MNSDNSWSIKMGSSDRFFENKYIIGNEKNIKGKINVIFAFLFICNID